MTRHALLVFVGGGLGSVARYLVALSMPTAALGFPHATLIVNAVGSFLFSLIMCLAAQTLSISEDVRLLLTTGLLGGFTTYSTFNHETLSRIQEGAWLAGVAYLSLTVTLCLAAGVLGLLVARLTSGA